MSRSQEPHGNQTVVNGSRASLTPDDRRRKQAKTRKSGARPPSKLSAIEKLLNRKSGATTAQLISATGWQAHSVRAVLSRLRKTGVVIDKTANKNGTTIYRTVAQS